MEKINNIELYDIYSTWHIPFYQTAWFYWTVITLGLSITGFFAFLFFKRYRQKQTSSQLPWQIALEKLHALQQKKYATKDAGKRCYFAMTSIIKEYLQAQLDINAIGKTDEELIIVLEKSSVIAKPVLKQLEEICNGCLYIKFANQEAVQKQIDEHLALSVQMVNETRPDLSQTT